MIKKEKVYGKFFLEMLYGRSFLSSILSRFFLPLLANLPFFSKCYGLIQKSKKSRKKIVPFIHFFDVDIEEFAEPVTSFRSFNDFFIRRLKPEARPLHPGKSVAILPADGRYLVFQNFSEIEGFYIKGKKFNLQCLLQNEFLFGQYKRGGMLIARLCPTDYHRFHFPCECLPGRPKLINGPLFSVNPLALRKHIEILNENKRVITLLKTKHFGQIAYIEIGATFVGSIQQTFLPEKAYEKGAEKGYFEFGGSCLILLFEPNTIQFDADLIENSFQAVETYAKMGESLGYSINYTSSS